MGLQIPPVIDLVFFIILLFFSTDDLNNCLVLTSSGRVSCFTPSVLKLAYIDGSLHSNTFSFFQLLYFISFLPFADQQIILGPDMHCIGDFMKA